MQCCIINWFKISGNDNELFIDDKDGALRTYYFVGTTKTIVNANFGTVDYIAGKINIPSANITTYLMLMVYIYSN